jgi:hypothetical protein
VGTIRVENRGHGSVDALIVAVIAAILLLGVVLWPAALIANRPSGAEVRRAEVAAEQQAQLDASWRPWITAAESVAVICGCLGVPTAIGLVSFMVVRRTRVVWPIEEARVEVRTPPARPSGGGGDSAVLVGVPTRPEPQDRDVDAA